VVTEEMTRTKSLYDACHELFTCYPLAVRAVNHSGTICSMVLMLRDGDDSEFFVLSRSCDEGEPSYSIFPWRAEGIVDIKPDDSASVPELFASAVMSGIPIPRHGSLWGWTCGDAVTALVVIYAKYSVALPQPSWSVMPLTGVQEAQWPPFTRERLFGRWFWEHYRAGSIIYLGGLIAGTPNTIFWADTKAILGSDCCVVTRDVRSPEGPTLRRGRYVYYLALQAGKPVPPLEVLLTDSSRTDLASRFQP
jgi:hypothetical protein